jgi:hypothetical protein
MCVVWHDAKGESGWMDPADYDPEVKVVSCGQLIKDGDEFIVLAMDKSEDGEVNQVGSIPRAWVISTQTTLMEGLERHQDKKDDRP